MRRAAAVLAALLCWSLIEAAPVAAVDPDRPGERLVYVDLDAGRVVFADLDGSDPTLGGEAGSMVQVSPDGERLVKLRERVDRAGSHVFADVAPIDERCIQMTVGEGRVSGVDWSPDGQHLAWTSFDSVQNGVWVQPTGPLGSRTRIAAVPNVTDPAWHPSGASIAFARATPVTFTDPFDIEAVDRDGSDRRVLVGGPTNDRHPAFSEDGRWLAFLRYDANGLARPIVANADGTGAQRVADVVLGDIGWWDEDTLVGSRHPNGEDAGIVLVDLDGTVTQLTEGRHISPQRSTKRVGAGADGYTLVGADGGLFHHGAACPPAANARSAARTPYVAAASTPDRETYWYVNATGQVDVYGSQTPYGEVRTPLAQPIVGMAPTPSGKGYWLVARDGGIFSFGDATFFGSTGAVRLNQPIVGMASTPTGKGYWLVAADGGIFSFGDARFLGSTGAMRLNAPVFAMAPTSSGRGYWLFARDGGVFSFGDARFHGSTGALRLNAPVTTVTPTGTGGGYWLFAADGGVFTFGDARFHGSLANVRLAAPIIGGVSRER